MDVKRGQHTLNVEKDQILLKFGVFSDVQYADIDNRMNYEKTAWRYYRDSKNKVKQLVDIWNNNDPVQFLLNLGDLIDGMAKRKGESEKCLKDIVDCLNDFSGNVYHTWGNHDFYNFQRDRLMKHHDLNSVEAARKKIISPDGNMHSIVDKAYYSIEPHEKLRIIMMDHYEFSALGRPDDDHIHVRALAFLKSKNHNEDLNDSTGLKGPNARFALYNGGPSTAQLQWLENQIREAENKKQYVIVAGHIPVHEKSAKESCLLWNYDSVQEILHRHSNVLAYLAGHDHSGAYLVDKRGLHHLTMNGLVEAEPGTLDYATVYLYPSKLQVTGSGNVPSFVIDLPEL